MTDLFRNKWMRVREIQHKLPDGTTEPYTTTTLGSGKSIAVLPYRRLGQGNAEILLRNEITPPWLVDSDDPEERVLSALTGMVDGDEDPLTAALRELYEEAGYQVDEEDVISLGYVRTSKASEDVCFLYAVDVTGLEPDTPPLDGGPFEPYAESVWVLTLRHTNDALVLALWQRFTSRLEVQQLILPEGYLP